MEEQAFQCVEFDEMSSEEFNGISIGRTAAIAAGAAAGIATIAADIVLLT